MIGLSNNSTDKELIVNQDESTATRYVVVEETLNLDALRLELEQLEATMPEPSDAELIEIGKMNHPYYMVQRDEERIAYIKQILGE